jgi:peptide/nickel transport system substrate-binding protein
VTRNIDNRRLGRLRQDQGEIANHIIDEFAAGRLSRREFIRRGAVVGISVPLLGSIIAACSSSTSQTTSRGRARISSTTSEVKRMKRLKSPSGRDHALAGRIRSPKS